jgi:hypothetical protein
MPIRQMADGMTFYFFKRLPVTCQIAICGEIALFFPPQVHRAFLFRVVQLIAAARYSVFKLFIGFASAALTD